MRQQSGFSRRSKTGAALAALAAATLAAVSAGQAPAGRGDFFAFESAPVRPLALSLDGRRLFAVNTPDARLEILAATEAGLQPLESVPVGLEPVAVAVLDETTVWVVNHLSDSVSVVDVGARPARVVRTLLVGDEPRDVVFAGAGRRRAFVTSAHRGQNSPLEPQLTTPGVGRADVWVFDADDLGAAFGGTPLTILTLFGDSPRALAATADGSRVYAAVFRSGNRTSVLGPPPSGRYDQPPPHESADGVPAPNTGLIVRFDGQAWRDEQGASFGVPFTLPDHDVFELDALASPPRETRRLDSVGTILFNMAVSPTDGTVFVSNLESRNPVRFSGLATRAATTVRGRVSDARLTLIRDGQVRPRLLNQHLDFDRRFGTAQERETSLSLPLDLAVSGDGARLYVTAFGSQKLGVFDTAALAEDRAAPGGDAQVELGRRAVRHRPRRGARARLRAHALRQRCFGASAPLRSPCQCMGPCDPDGVAQPIPNPFISISPAAEPAVFHPMKGPMTTQSLRGLANHDGATSGNFVLADLRPASRWRRRRSRSSATGALRAIAPAKRRNRSMRCWCWPTNPARPSPSPARRRARAGAWASTAIATASWTATPAEPLRHEAPPPGGRRLRRRFRSRARRARGRRRPRPRCARRAGVRRAARAPTRPPATRSGRRQGHDRRASRCGEIQG